MAVISQDRDTLRLHFDRYGIDDYRLFLKCKALPDSETIFDPDTETYAIETPVRFAHLLGVAPAVERRPELPLAEFLFDDQRDIVRMALAAKRFAVWSDCGLGKTLIELEFARQVVHATGGRVLIVTLNEIVGQIIDEAKRFYRDKRKDAHTLDCLRLMTRQEMRGWMKNGAAGGGYGIAITNYEKWNPESLDDQVVNEARYLSGVVLDESSRLKGGGGKQKWALIKSCKGIEYKLSCTATPAPNDIIEFASQASFLEKMRSESDIIWSYFVRDPKSHRWTVKPHARAAFFQWMSNWSIYVRHPKRYGWRLNLPDVPEPEVIVHKIDMTLEQEIVRNAILAGPEGQRSLTAEETATNAIQRMKLAQVAKGFRYRKGQSGKYDVIPSLKPGYVANLIHTEAGRGRQVLVWTSFDAEATLLAQPLAEHRDFEVLTGKTSENERARILERFRTGDCRVLITRAAVLGYGINLQCCTSMIFSGWSDSYESYYQAIRRAYRFGQTERVRVHLPVIEELEGDMLDNLFRKQGEHEAAIAEMESNYLAARGGGA